jgi:hypothetical protein
MCSYPCFGLSKTGFTPPSQLLKLIIIFLKKNKNRVAADAEIDNENCVATDPKINSQNCVAADAEIDSENCVAADAEIDSENCVINSIYICIYIFFFWVFTLNLESYFDYDIIVHPSLLHNNFLIFIC